MNWRDDFGTDRLLTEYEAPEVLEKYWTGGTTGYDSEGRPLFLMACKGMDFKGIFRSTSKTDLHKFHIKRMLRLLEIGKKQTQKVFLLDIVSTYTVYINLYILYILYIIHYYII